jgi:hypothetical protein
MIIAKKLTRCKTWYYYPRLFHFIFQTKTVLTSITELSIVRRDRPRAVYPRKIIFFNVQKLKFNV